MFSASTILKVYMAPRDAYSFTNFKLFHKFTKRRWRDCQIMGGQEIRVMENNRRHVAGYSKKLSIRGWNNGESADETEQRNTKSEYAYVDYVGNPYFDYYTFFSMGIVDWWGASGKIEKYVKPNRHNKNIYVPNTPAFDPGVWLEKDSAMEKIYLGGESFEKALANSRRGITIDMHILEELTQVYISEGMNGDEAKAKAERAFIIYLRNKAMVDNQLLDNDYNFTHNYYNRFIDKKIREMMPVNINFWFLKEALSNNPNLSFYVLGPYNILSRIQGIVSKRDQNVIIKMNMINRSKKSAFDFVYSVSKDTLVNEANKGFIYAKNLTPNNSFISNGLRNSRPIKVERRFNSEIFFDLILEGKTFKGYSPWFDSRHNCWLTPDYSDQKKLKGVDIVC